MQHLMTTYGRLPVAFTRGEGPWLWDVDGKRYLDGLCGIAVSGLGHAHPVLTRALCEQAGRLVHASNLYRIPEQEQLAERLCALAGMDRVFFCNSGCEANEAAIKLARLYGHQKGIDVPVIVVMEKAFHGRTMATLSATGSRKVQAGFEPLLTGFARVPYDDRAALEQVAANNANVVAVLVEPVQGEGGVNIPKDGYLAALREICDRKGWLLMLDEVQSGMARTGKWFGFQHSGVQPDVITLAKGLANGFPMGACLARGAAAETFKPGSHGSTFVLDDGQGRLRRRARHPVHHRGRTPARPRHRAGRDRGRRPAQAAGRRPRRQAGARPRPDDRHRARPPLRRAGAARPRCRPADQRHRGQRRPPAAAADPERRRGRPAGRRRRRAGPRLRRRRSCRGGLSVMQPVRHFLQFKDLALAEFEHVFERTRWIKEQFKSYKPYWPLQDRTLVMIFEKQSTRTRLSFEAGMHQLGGSAIYLNTRDSQLGRGEPVEDAAQVISRMCDLVMIRTFEQDIVERFARHSRVPVINGLTNEYHPCQILADIYTYIEKRGSIRGRTVAWVGDSNNVCNTWLQAATVFDFNVHVSTPPGYEVEPERAGVYDTSHFESFADPADAVAGADLVTTDVWTSMGFEAENAARKKAFEHWQVDAAMMALARPDALFMHCLPAHRGEEVAAEVIDGPQSVVWDEAENRLHTQKALMEFLALGQVER
jgi:ornithine carbamoyltransferase